MIKTDDEKCNTIGLEQEFSVEQFNSIRYRNILLIDNIDETLEDILSKNKNVRYSSSSNCPPILISVSKAIDSLLVDIFIKSRRFNCLTFAFVKTWSTIDVKNQLRNFIVMDSETAENLKMLRTVSNDKTRTTVREIFKELNKWLYNPIIVKDDEVFITKCEL